MITTVVTPLKWVKVCVHIEHAPLLTAYLQHAGVYAKLSQSEDAYHHDLWVFGEQIPEALRQLAVWPGIQVESPETESLLAAFYLDNSDLPTSSTPNQRDEKSR
jgi:hypothetical protein